MSMSNTAVPKYYAEYRDQVERGEIPVCREIEMEMNRINRLVADPNVFYDGQIVEGWIKFCEAECTLTNGERLELLPIFKVWGEQLLGWYHYLESSVPEKGPLGDIRYVTKWEKRRLIRKQFLIVARGAAKSMYASLLQNYFLNVDTDTTHQIAVAPTMKQAEEVMSPIRTAIALAPGPYFKLLTYGSIHNTTGDRGLRQQLVATKKGVENFHTGSLLEVRPMSINKLQGIRSKYNTVDEWLSGDIREDVIGALEQGASRLANYLIIAISSEGTVRNGAGDTIKLELLRILNPEDDYNDPHVSIWHYKLDHVDEINEPRMWLKANPNLGLTVGWDVYALDVKRAEANPATANDIMAKRFGLPVEGFTYYFSYEETKPHPRRERAFVGMGCALGCDLSQGDDFCAFTFLFPLRDGSFGIRTRSYISKRTLDKLPGALRIKYEEFLREGTLIVMEGVILDMIEVYDDLIAHITQEQYDVRAVGYDRYNAKEFIARWIQEHTEWGVVPVIQGARTESVPLGELKLLSEDRMLIFDESIMGWTMSHAMTMVDNNGNRKLVKKRNEEKVDNVSALMDAYVAFKAHQEEF